MKTWKKGAKYGFFVVPIFGFSYIIMIFARLIENETLAGIANIIFMIPFVIVRILFGEIGIEKIPIFTTTLFWTTTGATVGFIIDKWKEKDE